MGRGRRRPFVALCVAALLVGSAGGAAGDDAEGGAFPPLRDGAWVGSLSASGPVMAAFPDATVYMTTAMGGSVNLVVVDEEVVGGTWSVQGSASGIITASIGTGTVSNTFTGAGPVDAGSDALVLGGQVGTIWTMAVGGHTSVEQDPVNLGPFEVEITDTTCNTVLGRWDDAFAAEIGAVGGWDSVLHGTFEVHHTGPEADESLRDDLDDLVDDGMAFLDALDGGDLADDQGQVVVDQALFDQLIDLMTRTVILHEDIEGLGADEPCLFPEGIGEFTYVLTGLMQEIAWVLLQPDGGLNGEGLEVFADALLTFGGIGSGAIRQERATELEDLFAERLGEVIEDHLVTDAVATDGSGCTPSNPCLPDDPDVVSALLAAKKLGVTVEVAGETLGPDDIDDWLAWVDGEEG